MIHLSIPDLRGNEWKYLKECLDTNWITSVGRFLDDFENSLASFVGAKYAVACASGTAAMHVALQMLGVQAGDQVIVPATTFIATVNVVLYCQATPVIVDVEDQTFNMDPARLAEAINDHTKVILPVHLYGQPCQMDKIMAIAESTSVCVLEDACESIGTRYKKKHTGTFGRISAFSFNGNKLVTCGGGGMIVTDDEELARQCRHLVTQARSDSLEYLHDALGYNYRLTNMQAAVGLAQMERLEQMIDRRRQIFSKYQQGLAELPGWRGPGYIHGAQSNFWLYTALVEPQEFGMTSRELMACLRERQIEARPIFAPVCENKHLSCDDGRERFPVAYKIWEQGIVLPSGAGLTDQQIDQVIDAVRCAASDS
ncbi:MAG: aminotransferase class I/II-fold pyridoxal phosphate-dependent enzyme [Phycisphaerae bacterium]|nr:aminotransferase class I/II-fold pyridoxal phosphate-dependent enzyme [Phycisphaerae bacterium]